jgi:hypothetical protein
MYSEQIFCLWEAWFAVVQALCINPDVQKLRSAAGMNEKCLDLQKKKPSKNKAARSTSGRKARSSTYRFCALSPANGAVCVSTCMLVASWCSQRDSLLGVRKHACYWFAAVLLKCNVQGFRPSRHKSVQWAETVHKVEVM